MSTQVNTENQNEKVLPQTKENAAAKGTAHLASMGVSTTALLGALQAPSGAVGDDDSIFSFLSSMLLEDESQEELKTQAKQNFNLAQLASSVKAGADTSDAPGATKGTGTSHKNAIAESAELMSLLQNKAQKSLATELAQEEKVLQDELKAAQKEEALWDRFAKDWKDYKDDPNNANFQKLMKDIEAIYGKNSSQGREAEKEAGEAQHAWDKEQHWKHESGWDRFKSGQWWNPHDWRNFESGANGAVESLVGMAASKPGMFSLILDNMDQMVKDRIKNLTLQIQFLQVIESIVSGGGNAVVQMQALMNVMMQMGIANNEESTSRNQIMNNFNIMAMTQKEGQIDKDLKKLHASEHQSHGLFGWIEDIFKSIAQVLESIGHVFEDVCGIDGRNLSDLKGDLKKLNIANTPIGKDISNAIKLVVDTVLAIVESLGELVVAAADKIDGKTAAANKALDKAGKVWMKVAQNPALQAVLQIVMVAIIIAAVASGQLYLAAFMAVLFVLSASGALTDMTNAMAKSMGNSAVDKVIADVITIVLVTVLSLGVGFGGAVDAAADVATDSASTAAKQAAEETSAIAENGVEAATNAAENDSKSAGEKIGDAIKRLGQKIGPKAGAALTGFGTSVLDTNFGYDLADATASKKDKKKLEMILEIVFDVIGAIAAAAGGLGMVTSGIGEAADSAASNAVKKILPKLSEFFENNQASIMQFGSNLQKGALAVGGVAGVEEGLSQIEQGKLYEQLQEFMAEMNELNVSSDDLSRGMQNLTSQFKALTKEEGEINKNAFSAVAAGMEGVIRSLTGQV